MSGHSKFANIKHKKEKNDAKKGKIFTIIGREIVMAVKAGGPDPNNNGKLRDVIAKAKANNMPNDTIERGIKKAAGADSADSYEKAVYEGYGPNGVAIIVETLTDNKNRTASNVRNAFTKGNGSIGTQGCVSYMFDQKGQIIIDKEECEIDADELMMTALDAGAEDFNEEEDSYEVLTAPDDLCAVREALEAAGVPLLEAQVAMIPQTTVELTDEKSLKDIQRILDLLDDMIMAACSFVIGIYDGFYGPGTGTFLLLTFTKLGKLDMEKATGNVKVVNLTSNISALITFVLAGKILWVLGLSASIFSIAGHYLGAHMVVKNGVKVIKPIILLVLVLLMIKIILGI